MSQLIHMLHLYPLPRAAGLGQGSTYCGLAYCCEGQEVVSYWSCPGLVDRWLLRFVTRSQTELFSYRVAGVKGTIAMQGGSGQRTRRPAGAEWLVRNFLAGLKQEAWGERGQSWYWRLPLAGQPRQGWNERG